MSGLERILIRPGAFGGTALGLVLVVASSIAFGQAPEKYRIYRNDRFGTTADVPRDWKPGNQPANGDGLRFTSPDGAAFISVSGSFDAGDVRGEALENEQLADDGETITYRVKQERLSVVSGTRGDVIFYRKAMMSCGDEIVNRLAIEYPATRKAAFDALVTHVAGSLRAGKGFQTDNCK
jgi:hypothetical protein